MGIEIAFIPQERPSALGAVGLPPDAVVWKVERGPGNMAGLHVQDVVVSINGEAIKTQDDLRRVLRSIGPGTSRYLIRRGSDTLTLDIDCPTCKVT